MAYSQVDLRTGPAAIAVIGDCGSPLARGLRGMGHRVTELLPSDFAGQCPEAMLDVVAVLPDCRDTDRVGASAAACAGLVWFDRCSAPPLVAELLHAAGVPVIEGKDLLEECRA